MHHVLLRCFPQEKTCCAHREHKSVTVNGCQNDTSVVSRSATSAVISFFGQIYAATSISSQAFLDSVPEKKSEQVIFLDKKCCGCLNDKYRNRLRIMKKWGKRGGGGWGLFPMGLWLTLCWKVKIIEQDHRFRTWIAKSDASYFQILLVVKQMRQSKCYLQLYRIYE